MFPDPRGYLLSGTALGQVSAWPLMKFSNSNSNSNSSSEQTSTMEQKLSNDSVAASTSSSDSMLPENVVLIFIYLCA